MGLECDNSLATVRHMTQCSERGGLVTLTCSPEPPQPFTKDQATLNSSSTGNLNDPFNTKMEIPPEDVYIEVMMIVCVY